MAWHTPIVEKGCRIAAGLGYRYYFVRCFIICAKLSPQCPSTPLVVDSRKFRTGYLYTQICLSVVLFLSTQSLPTAHRFLDYQSGGIGHDRALCHHSVRPCSHTWSIGGLCGLFAQHHTFFAEGVKRTAMCICCPLKVKNPLTFLVQTTYSLLILLSRDNSGTHCLGCRYFIFSQRVQRRVVDS